MRLKLFLAAGVACTLLFLGLWLKSRHARPTVEQSVRQDQTASPSRAQAPSDQSLKFSTPPAATAGQKTLLLAVASTWDKSAAATEFARFVEWAERYQSTKTGAAKTALEAEGTQLAAERRWALAQLIQSDPKRALEL